MTLKVRYLFRNAGDHFAFRDASEHVPDPRDHPDAIAAFEALDRRLLTEHDAIAFSLIYDPAGQPRGKVGAAPVPSLAEFEKAVADKAAATARHAADRDALLAALRAQAVADQAARVPAIAAEPGEIEFDHMPSEDELKAAFAAGG